MSTYEIVKDLLEKVPAETLVRIGFMKQTAERNLLIYERYLSYMGAGANKPEAVTWTAEDCSCSEVHVYTVVKRFSEGL